MAIVCPKCQSTDVQRAGGVIAQGTTFEAADLVKETKLSRDLALPDGLKPDWRLQSWASILLYLCLLAITIFAITVHTTNVLHTPNVLRAALVLILGLLLPGLTFIIVISAHLSRYLWLRGKWKTAKARWKETYYCHRCGSVFVPDKPALDPKPFENLKDFLLS